MLKRLLKFIILNVPVVILIILKYFSGTNDLTQIIYIGSVMLGYYPLFLFAVMLPAFILSFVPKISKIVAIIMMFIINLYFLADSIVFSIYKFHINNFFINMFFTDFQNFGMSSSAIITAIGISVGLLILELLLWKFSMRLPNKITLLFIVFIISAFFSQALYTYALEKSITTISNLSHKFPLYFPIESKELADKTLLASFIDKTDGKNFSELNYPKKELKFDSIQRDSLYNILFIVLESTRFDMFNPEVMPNVYKFSKKATVCRLHFSTGSVTIPGIFGLFYSIHPTYWQDVKEARKVLHNPVFIDFIQHYNYSSAVFSHSNLERFKIHSAIFDGIKINETFAGNRDSEKDASMTDSLIRFINTSGKPFFSFIFYKSSHHSYDFPENNAKFKPYKHINMALIDNDSPRLPYLNAYKNSIYYLDGLINKILKNLEQKNLLNKTIIVITSDHGEEFNENKFNYWGHGSNFTRYQTQVPLVLFIPGKTPQEIQHNTSHIDLVPTILQEAFGFNYPTKTYSNGKNLYKIKDNKRPLVVMSYVNQGIIMDKTVWELTPLGIKKYNINGIRTKAPSPPQGVLQQAFNETSYFYK